METPAAATQIACFTVYLIPLFRPGGEVHFQCRTPSVSTWGLNSFARSRLPRGEQVRPKSRTSCYRLRLQTPHRQERLCYESGAIIIQRVPLIKSLCVNPRVLGEDHPRWTRRPLSPFLESIRARHCHWSIRDEMSRSGFDFDGPGRAGLPISQAPLLPVRHDR
jgi:hypothetical protein